MLKAWPPRAKMCASTGAPAARYLFTRSIGRLDVAVVVVRADDEQRRRIGGDAFVGNPDRARVNDHLEIGAAVEAVDRVGGVGSPYPGLYDTMATTSPPAEKPSMPTRLGSMCHSAGAAADQPHRPIGVLADVRCQLIRRVLLAGEAILEHERRDAEPVEVLRRVASFGIEHQLSMSAAGHDNDRRARRFVGRREEDRHRRIVNVADPVVLR